VWAEAAEADAGAGLVAVVAPLLAVVAGFAGWAGVDRDVAASNCWWDNGFGRFRVRLKPYEVSERVNAKNRGELQTGREFDRLDVVHSDEAAIGCCSSLGVIVEMRGTARLSAPNACSLLERFARLGLTQCHGDRKQLLSKFRDESYFYEDAGVESVRCAGSGWVGWPEVRGVVVVHSVKVVHGRKEHLG